MSEYTQAVCHDGAAILKDGVPLTVEQILEALRERDEYRNHLAVIAEMTGNAGDIGATHEGVNALVEELARHKRLFAATCQQLGSIQQALGSTVVGIEPALVRELVEERDTLAAHVGQLTSIAEKVCTISPEYLDHLGSDAAFALKATPANSLARHDAKTLRKYADMLEVEEGVDAEAGVMWDASQCAEWMREHADAVEAHQ